MVSGGVPHERIALTEGTFWSGRPHDYNNPEAHQYFGQIRDLVFAGRFQEAEKRVDQHFLGVPAAQQAYQPLGDLLLSFGSERAATDYLLSCPVNGTVSSTIIGTATGRTTGTGGTIRIYIT
jgi:alpha-L-fucosidase 2